MRAFITATGEELAAHLAVVEDVLRELDWAVIPPRRSASVGEGLAEVQAADLVLSLVGWRRGPLPTPEAGGDGVRSWAALELGRAFEMARPALVFMADKSWPSSVRESDPESHGAVMDLRGELGQLGVAVAHETGPPADFRQLLRAELTRWHDRSQHRVPTSPSTTVRRQALVTWPPPPWPAEPWPLLLPCAHPALLGGRDRELTELQELVGGRAPITLVHAASGAGKSSLLAAGLVPSLRASGRAVAFDRHPDEPGLAARLIGDLVTGSAAESLDDEDFASFVSSLAAVRRQSGAPAVLVLDQFEDALRRGRRPRALVGALLAATVQRQSGWTDSPCRWILAYRREHHGELLRWLGDVLREARAEAIPGADALPYDLSKPERTRAWALPVLGAPPPGATDPAAAATPVFLEAILRPLAARDGARPRYRWRFAEGSAERLAAAFGRARERLPEAPLTPELQVVLGHLMGASTPDGEGDVMTVPAEPDRLIEQALEAHLRRALDSAFPGLSDADRVGRTRALLALRQLADDHGRRSAGRSQEDLVRALGSASVLERLTTASTRLVVPSSGGWRLAHDRLAELIVRAVEGGPVGLSVDPDLLAADRLVQAHCELIGEDDDVATRLSGPQVKLIAAHAEILLSGDDRSQWWSMVQVRLERDRRRKWMRRSAAAGIVLMILAGAWWLAKARQARIASLERLAKGEPAVALRALLQGLATNSASPDELWDQLSRRAHPHDILEKGLIGLPPQERAAAVIAVGELLQPRIDQDPVPLATFIWALDFTSINGLPTGRAAALRAAALEPLRRTRPPPTLDGWALSPGGTVQIGDAADDSFEEEAPVHEVVLGPFRILDHEVTNAEYRLFDPAHEGEDRLPATGVDWYEAYVFAAWLGGRLATESEWESAASGGCRYQACDRDGEEIDFKEAAWVLPRSLDFATGHSHVRAVAELTANPLGVHDMLGNVREWTADWYGEYDESRKIGPWGPASGDQRVVRGATFWQPATFARSTFRDWFDPGERSPNIGIRPVLPGPGPEAGSDP